MGTEVEIAARIIRAHAEGSNLDASAMPIVDDLAYAIQGLVTQSRLARGESIVGWKLGYTSAAMREQMGIADPNFGPLTDVMVVPDGSVLPPARHPKVEPEIALVMGDSGVASARIALEIVDSIWSGYQFTWAQNTADGSSAAFVVLGDELPLASLGECRVELLRNGESVGSGSSDAAMGHPMHALEWLVEELGSRGEALRPGEFVITGGLCAAVDFAPGDVVSARSDVASVQVRRA